jgi:hypothetical protein
MDPPDPMRAWYTLSGFIMAHEVLHAVGANDTKTHNFLMSGTRDWQWLEKTPMIEKQTEFEVLRTLDLMEPPK